MNKNTVTIITIGDELLLGQVIDTNSAWLAQELSKIGLSTTKRIAIGDNEEDILSTLESGLIASEVVIITGGLGPTSDDITKPTLCKFFGCSLVRNPEILAHVQEFFIRRKKPILERNERQADLPDCCEILFNEYGTAPGMWFQKNEKIIISLPGVPYEMQRIMHQYGLQKLQERFVAEKLEQRHLLTAGLGESSIAEMLKDEELNLPTNISLAYLPGYGLVRLRLTEKFKNKENSTQTIDAIHSKLKEKLRDIMLGAEDITMPQLVARTLIEKSKTVAIAESCTAGLVASKLTDIPGSSAYFQGGVVVYSYQAKENILQVPNALLLDKGAVSKEVVEHMAIAVRGKFSSDFSVAISGILGPDGGTEDKVVGTVWFAVADANGCSSQMHIFSKDRLVNKELSVNMALLLLYKKVISGS